MDILILLFFIILLICYTKFNFSKGQLDIKKLKIVLLDYGDFFSPVGPSILFSTTLSS